MIHTEKKVVDVSEGPGMEGIRAIIAQIKALDYCEEIILRGSPRALALCRLLRLQKIGGVILQEVFPV